MSRDTCERCLGTSHLCPRGDLNPLTWAVAHPYLRRGGPRERGPLTTWHMSARGHSHWIDAFTTPGTASAPYSIGRHANPGCTRRRDAPITLGVTIGPFPECSMPGCSGHRRPPARRSGQIAWAATWTVVAVVTVWLLSLRSLGGTGVSLALLVGGAFVGARWGRLPGQHGGTRQHMPLLVWGAGPTSSGSSDRSCPEPPDSRGHSPSADLK
jgi:hypothetical protein